MDFAGAEAQRLFWAICGMTEVMPCYKALRFCAGSEFFRSL
jgi:hypothetical protein